MLTLPRKKCIVMSEQELSYEVAVKELQQIVDRMQSPECEVDEMCELIGFVRPDLVPKIRACAGMPASTPRARASDTIER